MDKKAPQDERNLCNKCSELHFYSFDKNFNKEDKFIYIICNLDKLKKSDVAPVEEENERDETYQGSNTCIDSSRTHQNYHTVCLQGKYLDVIEDRISGLNLKRKVRSDAVYMCSFVLTASPEFFKVATPDKQQRFFRDFTNFFKDKYGEENVLSAIVHLDETNPHMHLNLIPIVDGKLCAKELFDGQLVKLQTEIWKEVGQKYGLERGKSGNGVEHLSTAEYKAKKILEEAESKKAETEDYAEALTQAEQGEFAWSKGGLKKQIVALTAENAELKKRLDTSMGEVLELDKENKELKEHKVKTSIALTVLDRLKQEHPDIYREVISQKKKPTTSEKKNWWTK